MFASRRFDQLLYERSIHCLTIGRCSTVAAALWFATLSTASAQHTERVSVSLQVEHKDTGEGVGRCVATLFARFADVPGATSYTMFGYDGLVGGGPFTRSGPPFNDDFAWYGLPAGTIPVPPPGGMHQFGLTGGAALCGPQVALLESWKESRFNFGGYDWHVIANLPSEPPVAEYTWNVSDENPLLVSFDATSSTDDHQIVSYEWDFDDGNVDSGAVVTHEFAEEREYVVKLKVTDNDDIEDVETKTIPLRAARLRYAVRVDPSKVSKDESFYFKIDVSNIGTVDVFEVTINGLPQTQSKDGGSVEQVSGLQPEFVSSLSPGTVATFLYEYRGNDFGTVEMDLSGFTFVQGVDSDSKEVLGVCDAACSAFEEIDGHFQVDLRFAASGKYSNSVKSGLKNDINISFINSLGFPPGCLSGCADVVVTVTNPGTGTPVEGVDVNVGAPVVSGPEVVTPFQGGGFFCDHTDYPACGNPQSLLKTNSDGIARGIYWVPGVTKPVEANITTRVEKQGYQATIETASLTIEDNLVFDGQFDLNANDQLDLGFTTAVSTVSGVVNFLPELCKVFYEKILDVNRKVRIPTLDVLAPSGIDELCKDAPKTPVVGDVLDNLKKLSELSQIDWFLQSMNLRGDGLVTAGPSLSSWIPEMRSDFFKAVVDGIKLLEPASGVFVPTTLHLKLYEVSYTSNEGELSGDALLNPVDALFFDLEIAPRPGPSKFLRTFVSVGYNAQVWLTPSISTLLQGPALPGDRRVEVESNDDFSAGDFVTLNPGQPNEEANQVTGFGSLILAAPLKYAHSVNEPISLLSGGQVSVPEVPIQLAPVDSSVGIRSALLEWSSHSATVLTGSYGLMVGLDADFQTIVVDTSGITESEFALSDLEPLKAYFWKVRGFNTVGESDWSSVGTFTTAQTVNVERSDDTNATPYSIMLEPNYPNPFNPSTTISFNLPIDAHVRLAVYDILGREVSVLVDARQAAGRHEARFEASRLSSGVYLYRLEAEGQTLTGRMILLK